MTTTEATYRVIAADADAAVAEAVERVGREGRYIYDVVRSRRSPKAPGERRFVDGEFRHFPEFVVVIRVEA